MDNDEHSLQKHLNGETAKIEWAEVERHFAQGLVIRVDPSLDLVTVAVQMVRDDANAIRVWMADGKLRKATDTDARIWSQTRPLFWAVVAAPWVLIQPIENTDPRSSHHPEGLT